MIDILFFKNKILESRDSNKWKIGNTLSREDHLEFIFNIYSLHKEYENQLVIKLALSSDGPLFTEMHFYIRLGTKTNINSWKKKHTIKHLGIPSIVQFGVNSIQNEQYRFLILEKYDTDLQKKLDQKKKLELKLVLKIGYEIIKVLEYIHTNNYVHLDIKPKNIMLKGDKIYLIDFDVVTKLSSTLRDCKKIGTLLFNSRDIQKKGKLSRKNDLESLLYTLVILYNGNLPWENDSDKNMLLKKEKFINTEKVNYLNSNVLIRYTDYIKNLKLNDIPDYNLLKKLFSE